MSINKYKIVLSKKGQEIFKGGNIEIMQKVLIEFKAENIKKAEKYFENLITETLGSASLWNYELKEVSKLKNG